MLKQDDNLNFSVECSEENGVITTKIICYTQYDDLEYAYYLCNGNDEVLQKQMYIKENTFKFEINKYGSYYVKGFVLYGDNEDNLEKITRESNMVVV